MTKHIPIVLTIADSDRGGGAGEQADIKAVAAAGAYCASVITAATAQNTRAVTVAHNVAADIVAAQLDAAIAARLAQGFDLKDAVAAVHEYRQAPIKAAHTVPIGKGHGPVHPFHGQWG